VRLFALLCVIAVALLVGTSRFSFGPSDEQLDELEEAIATALPNALGPNTELKRGVDAVLLPGMNKSKCEWGSSSHENEPKSWYGCWDYVSGDPVRISKTVQSRLRSRGFDVSGIPAHLAVQFTAVRNGKTVCVDVLAPGFTYGRNTSPEEINPGPRDVFVDVWMVEPRDRTHDPCNELPAWPEE
jgi:hypothetical protein